MSKIDSFLNKIKENKKLRITLIFVCILIVAIILLSDIFPKAQQQKVKESNVDYVQNLENNLTKILSKIEDAGKVDVMITIEGGNETVLASSVVKKQNGNTTEIEETPILVNGKTVVLKENYPKIQGVIVVCEGAKKIAVVSAIKNATTSLLNIENEKIQVLKMK